MSLSLQDEVESNYNRVVSGLLTSLTPDAIKMLFSKYKLYHKENIITLQELEEQNSP